VSESFAVGQLEGVSFSWPLCSRSWESLSSPGGKVEFSGVVSVCGYRSRPLLGDIAVVDLGDVFG
jgi:hypothetical protein